MLPPDSQRSNSKDSFLSVRMGLVGQDEHIEVLQDYFKQMQTMTVETSMDPDIDLLTFALSAHYFGVVMMDVTDLYSYKHAAGFNVPTVEDVLPRDLDDAELAELNIPRPITVEGYLALSEQEQLDRWIVAWECKRRGSLYDDEVRESIGGRRGKRIVRPGDIDYYMSDEDDGDVAADKGKTREPGVPTSSANPYPSVDSIPESINDHFINWPEDMHDGGPPSSDDDFYSVSTDAMSDSSPTPCQYHEQQFGSFPMGNPPPPMIDPNFGREYFEPDTSERPPELPPLPEDPIAKDVVREAASRKTIELRAQTVHLYEKKMARLLRRHILAERNKENNGQARTQVLPAVKPPTTKAARPIGLVYLTSSQNFSDPLHKGEFNIGFYIAPKYRTVGRLSAVLHRAIEDAFRDPDCHRLQAVLVDHPDILDSLSLYASAGFKQEGIRRKAFFSQIAGEWKDVTYLAILATEWIHDRSNLCKAKLLPSSLWDEILSRHQREQEELVKMEAQKAGCWPGRGLKRSSSLETIRETVTVPTALSVESGAESSSGFTTDTSNSSFDAVSGSSFKGRKFGSSSSSSSAAGLLGNNSKRSSKFRSSSESGFESDWDMASVDDRDFFSVGGSGPSSVRFTTTTMRSQSST